SLANTDRCPALAQHLTVAQRKAADYSVRTDFRGRPHDLLVAERIREPDVGGDVAGEEEDVLLNVADQGPQLLERHRSDVDAVDRDPSALWIVEPHEQVDDCRLP